MENNSEKTVKITDKMFWQNVILTVGSILVCLIMLCSTTFAWFSGETSSNSNKLASGHFDIIIALTKEADGGASQATEVLPDSQNSGNGSSTYTLPAGTYVVTLTLEDTASAKGHCVVEIGGVKKSTEVIIGEGTANKDGFGLNSPLTFKLTITEADTKVTFTPRWGISVDSTLEDDQTYSSADWVVTNTP